MNESNEMFQQDALYTLAEVAKVLRVSRITLSRAIGRRELRAFRVGNQWRLRGLDVNKYLRSSLRESAATRVSDLETGTRPSD